MIDKDVSDKPALPQFQCDGKNDYYYYYYGSIIMTIIIIITIIKLNNEGFIELEHSLKVLVRKDVEKSVERQWEKVGI